jgi:hypothetical protein
MLAYEPRCFQFMAGDPITVTIDLRSNGSLSAISAGVVALEFHR